MAEPLYQRLNRDWKLKLEKRKRKKKKIPNVGENQKTVQHVPFGMTLTPERIEELRKMPYADYLKTEEWQIRRKFKLRQVGYRCQKCKTGNLELNVHHTTYQNRGNEAETDLKVLCKFCHKHEHVSHGDIET